MAGRNERRGPRTKTKEAKDDDEKEDARRSPDSTLTTSSMAGKLTNVQLYTGLLTHLWTSKRWKKALGLAIGRREEKRPAESESTKGRMGLCAGFIALFWTSAPSRMPLKSPLTNSGSPGVPDGSVRRRTRLADEYKPRYKSQARPGIDIYRLLVAFCVPWRRDTNGTLATRQRPQRPQNRNTRINEMQVLMLPCHAAFKSRKLSVRKGKRPTQNKGLWDKNGPLRKNQGAITSLFTLYTCFLWCLWCQKQLTEPSQEDSATKWGL